MTFCICPWRTTSALWLRGREKYSLKMLFLEVSRVSGVCSHWSQQESYHWHQWEQDCMWQFDIYTGLRRLLFWYLDCMSCLHEVNNANKRTNHYQQTAVIDNLVSLVCIVLQQRKGYLYLCVILGCCFPIRGENSPMKESKQESNLFALNHWILLTPPQRSLSLGIKEPEDAGLLAQAPGWWTHQTLYQ